MGVCAPLEYVPRRIQICLTWTIAANADSLKKYRGLRSVAVAALVHGKVRSVIQT